MRYWTGMLALLWSATLFAAGPSVVRKQIQASMMVTGSISIEPDGSVSQLAIDGRDKLPVSVVKVVEDSGSSWKFEPLLTDGVPRKANARMNVRVVGKTNEAGEYAVTIRNAYFSESTMTVAEFRNRPDSIKPIRMPIPIYPVEAYRRGARGTAYVAVKVGRQGTVEDAIVQQVNLRYVGSESDMKRMRELFTGSVLAVIRKWTFRVPAESDPAEFWTVRVPFGYEVEKNKYGKWQVYIPGPVQPIPWSKSASAEYRSPDALVPGAIYEVGAGLRLLTPLQSL